MSTSLSKHPSYFLYTVVFLVEDCLFSIPVHHFPNDCEILPPEYPLANPTGEGFSIQNPRIIKDTTIVEFERLLEVLIPLKINSSVDALSCDDWISVLKLSTRWKLSEVRSLAIKRLSPILETMDCNLLISLARDYIIPDWLRSGYENLALQFGPLTSFDGEQIGNQALIKICQFRESAYKDPYFSVPEAVRDMVDQELNLKVPHKSVKNKPQPKREEPKIFVEQVLDPQPSDDRFKEEVFSNEAQPTMATKQPEWFPQSLSVSPQPKVWGVPPSSEFGSAKKTVKFKK